jgi:hypothetical protein
LSKLSPQRQGPPLIVIASIWRGARSLVNIENETCNRRTGAYCCSQVDNGSGNVSYLLTRMSTVFSAFFCNSFPSSHVVRTGRAIEAGRSMLTVLRKHIHMSADGIIDRFV